MLMRTFIVLIAALAAGAALAQAYKWVDEDGVVHYSDTPQEGAEQIQLSSDGRRPQRPAYSPPPQVAQTADEDAAAAPQVFKYDSIEVIAPAPEETLWNIEGVLNVALRVNPALRPEDQVRVYFDGEQQLVSGTNFQLQEVWRGVHNIQAEIVDPTGRLMARSLPNRFYVQQNSIAN
jgi:hypothetical protein